MRSMTILGIEQLLHATLFTDEQDQVVRLGTRVADIGRRSYRCAPCWRESLSAGCGGNRPTKCGENDSVASG